VDPRHRLYSARRARLRYRPPKMKFVIKHEPDRLKRSANAIY
jgi:hypothetical protein